MSGIWRAIPFVALKHSLSDSAIVSLNAEMAQMKEAWVQLLSRMSKEDRAVLGNQNLNFNAVGNLASMLHTTPEL